MKTRLSTPRFLIILITATSFEYKSERVFEKEILVDIEEMYGAGGTKLKQDPLTMMSRVEKERLCNIAKEIASLSDDSKESHLYTRLYMIKPDNGQEHTAEKVTTGLEDNTVSWHGSIPGTPALPVDEEIATDNQYAHVMGQRDKYDEYEEKVALVCPTIPVVHLGLGDVADEIQIKIMFSYVFSVEAIHSIIPVLDDEAEDELKKSHLHTFEQEQLHALCNITRKRVPIEHVTFARDEITRPKMFEITFLPDSKRPNRRDVVIECPLNPYTTYLRYQPPNEMKIMIRDTALLELLKNYGFDTQVLVGSVKMPAQNEE